MVVAVLSEVPEASAQSSDPGPGKVIAIVPMAGPQGLAVNTTTNRIYVASDARGSTTNGLWRINGATLTTTPRVSLPADRFPFGVAVNPATNRVYLTNLSRSFPYSTGSVIVLNEATGSVSTIEQRRCAAEISQRTREPWNSDSLVDDHRNFDR